MHFFFKKTIVLLLFAISNAVIAQIAPNITFTDSDGYPHNLYEDYLDNGKIVVIKIFFTSCPPCNTIAPHIRNLYVEYGSGQNDVEFIELSNKSYDSNTLINNYKAKFNITFPSAGNDGGSLTAIAPYTNGTFGPFYSTPTFVVISPEKQVIYNPRGSIPTGMIAELEKAMRTFGARKPNEPNEPNEPPTYKSLAEDFTFNDVDNNQISLYNDLLKNNKRVVIASMGYCPECEQYAQALQDRYKYWGNGSQDVEFIWIDKDRSHAEIINLKGNSNSQYPFTTAGAGILDSFVNTFFNNIYGTGNQVPTFSIIDTSGQIYFNIGGDQIRMTQDSIDYYLEYLGAEPGKVPFQFTTQIDVSPEVEFDILMTNKVTDFVDTISLKGQSNYTFNFIDQKEAENLELSLEYRGEDHHSGVSTLDIVDLSKHLLGYQKFSEPWQILAGDANDSGSLSTLDIVEIRKLLLRINPKLSSPGWKIIHTDCLFESQPLLFKSNCMPVIKVSDIIDGSVNPSFTFVKIGDVNGTTRN